MKNYRITIGIPAYNEEANIALLLTYLLKQRLKNGTIVQILIISDGSTDNTVVNAKGVHDPRIEILDRTARLGQNATQNEIVKKSVGDILILLNGDVIPHDNHLLEELLAPFSQPNIGLVGGNTAGVSPKTVVEWALNTGHEFKQNVYKQLNGGETLFLCHGRVRAFSQALYSRLVWPLDCPEDAYSYLRCEELGFHFRFSQDGKIRFRSPQTISEHAKQSMRFLHGPETLNKYFPTSVVKNAYDIPKHILIKTLVWFGWKHPFSMAAYIYITVVTQLLYTKRHRNLTHWEVSTTSKKVL